MTLDNMTAHTITNSSYSEYISIYNKLLSTININSIQKLSSKKYTLRRRDWFSIDKRPEKQELSTETDDVITKWFTKSQI